MLSPRHAAAQLSHLSMGDRNRRTYERASSVEDDGAVVLHKVDSHDKNSGCDRHDGAAERIHLRSTCHYDDDDDDDEEGFGDAGEEEDARGRGNSLEGSEEKTLCPPAFCVRRKPASPEGRKRTRTSVSLK